MNIINVSSSLQNFRENLNFGNFFQNNCRVNSEICVYVSKYQYKISVLFHTFCVTFGKGTDSECFEYNKNNIVQALQFV